MAPKIAMVPTPGSSAGPRHFSGKPMGIARLSNPPQLTPMPKYRSRSIIRNAAAWSPPYPFPAMFRYHPASHCVKTLKSRSVRPS